MRKRTFQQVDVFARTPLGGNPVAVVLDGADLDDAQMQAFARWTNLSETTFVLPATDPAADYRLRIFTPEEELPFAGHPTLGSAHAVRDAGIVDARKTQLVQQCAAGLIPVRFAGDGQLEAQAPAQQITALDTATQAKLVHALGAPLAAGATPLAIDVGPVWIIADLGDAESVTALRPDIAALAALATDIHHTGITVFGRCTGGEAQVTVRSFVPASSVPEDPVCGSGNVSVAAYLHARGDALLATQHFRYTARQGENLQRDGRVQLRVDAVSGRVYFGGNARSVIRGEVEL